MQGALLTTNGERNVWQHVAYTVDPQGIRVYLNGELIGEETKDLTELLPQKTRRHGISQGENVMVGSGAIWDDEDVEDARFDNVKVYFGALTAAEIQTLYEEG